MAFKELVKTRQFARSHVAIAAVLTILPLVKALFAVHEGAGIFLNFFAHSRVLRKKLLQCRMARHEPLVIHERGILLQLFRNLRMAVHKCIHISEFASRDVVAAIVLPVFPPVIALFAVHKGAGIFLDLLAHSRVIRKKLLQSRMIRNKFLVIYERRILLQLFRDLRMAVHKGIHIAELASGHVRLTASAVIISVSVPVPIAIHITSSVKVAVSISVAVLTLILIWTLILILSSVLLAIIAAVKSLLLVHDRVRILRQLFAHFRMLLKIMLQIAMALEKLLVVDQRRILAQFLREVRMVIEKLIERRGLLTIQRSIISIRRGGRSLSIPWCGQY